MVRGSQLRTFEGRAGAVQAGKGKLRGDVLVHSWGLQRRQSQAFLRDKRQRAQVTAIRRTENSSP